MEPSSLQETLAPRSDCFGCGPANAEGLRLRSFRAEDDPSTLVCTFTPKPHHRAFEGVLNGGIVGTLLDCHSNWTAMIHFMDARGLDSPPCCVTAKYEIKLRRPTPTGGPVHLRATVVHSEGDRADVEAELVAGGRVCATCTGVFVAVKPDHPAYHRW
jgi:acyl-coenzyme A thioesterase PaaI-like protein